MESIIFTTDASIVLAELLGGIMHENLFIVADKHTVGFCDRLFEKVDWIPSHVTVLDLSLIHIWFRIQFSDPREAMNSIVEASYTRGWQLTELQQEKSSLDTIFAELSKK